ncbi:MAG: hypothetical protein ACR2QK_07845, partial [Acidimicrobiales bacterium]
MSDDLPPPDLIDTAELPLDEFSRKIIQEPVHEPPTDAEVEAKPVTLFSDARTVGLRGPATAGTDDGGVLEGAERAFSSRLKPTESIDRVRGFFATGRDQVAPIHRRQGTLALVGLC